MTIFFFFLKRYGIYNNKILLVGEPRGSPYGVNPRISLIKEFPFNFFTLAILLGQHIFGQSMLFPHLCQPLKNTKILNEPKLNQN